MFPNITICNMPYCENAYIKLLGQGVNGRCSVFNGQLNLPHHIIGQGSIGMVFSAALSSFKDFIVNIVFSGPKKKMFWVYARWVVTMMQHREAIWYKAIGNNPSDTVGKPMLTVFSSTNSKPAIKFFVFCAKPQPTPICLIDITPKSNFKRSSWSRLYASLTTIFTLPLLNTGWFYKKIFAACQALYTKALSNEFVSGRLFFRHLFLLFRDICLGCRRTFTSLAAVLYYTTKSQNNELIMRGEI